MSTLRNFQDVVLSPVRFFHRVDESTSYGAALCTIVGVLALIGYARVGTGLVNRDVKQAAERAVARHAESRRGAVSDDRLSEELREIREASMFWDVMASGWSILAAPVGFLGRVFIGAGGIFVVVALSGRRPEYAAMIAVFAFAGVTTVFGELLRLGVMLREQSTAVDLSLTVLVRQRESIAAPLYLVLKTVDPFAIWYWTLVVIGASITQMLPWPRTLAVCLLLGGVDSLGRAAIDVLTGIFTQRGLMG